jgi:hypothetical protein
MTPDVNDPTALPLTISVSIRISERRVATLTPIDLRMDPPVSDSRRVVDQLVEVLREEIRALSDALTETEV